MPEPDLVAIQAQEGQLAFGSNILGTQCVGVGQPHARSTAWRFLRVFPSPGVARLSRSGSNTALVDTSEQPADEYGSPEQPNHDPGWQHDHRHTQPEAENHHDEPYSNGRCVLEKSADACQHVMNADGV
jgi:hypothetical protein